MSLLILLVLLLLLVTSVTAVTAIEIRPTDMRSNPIPTRSRAKVGFLLYDRCAMVQVLQQIENWDITRVLRFASLKKVITFARLHNPAKHKFNFLYAESNVN